MRYTPWIAATGIVALTIVAWQSYESAGLQLAWERLLAFCGH
jgi:hypothetical protein